MYRRIKPSLFRRDGFRQFMTGLTGAAFAALVVLVV